MVTAAYAADGFNLRADLLGPEGAKNKGRLGQLKVKPLLKEITETDFLQGVCLLHTYERQQQDMSAGKTGKDVTGVSTKRKDVTSVSAKREHILAMPTAAYEAWKDRLTAGFLEAEQFLSHLGFHDPKYLPYRQQLIPLAATLAHIRERWLEGPVQDKLARWFWCGVFGELYGGASESRIALDLQELLKWINGELAPEPRTVTDAGFTAKRLDSMSTRKSAAYCGLYVLLQHQGAKDFAFQVDMKELHRQTRPIDIHHIFPKKWCVARGIPSESYNSIVNKTAISTNANQTISGNAPSVYLGKLERDERVQLDPAEMDAILRTHAIDPELLRADDHDGFCRTRRTALLALIENAMGKTASLETEIDSTTDDDDTDDGE